MRGFYLHAKSCVSIRAFCKILVSCLRQGMLTTCGAPSTTSHLDSYICPFLIIWGVVLVNVRRFPSREGLIYS